MILMSFDAKRWFYLRKSRFFITNQQKHKENKCFQMLADEKQEKLLRKPIVWSREL